MTEFGAPFLLIDVLSRHSCPFVIIGGHAVAFHGHVRATEDTDIVFLRTPESERALFDALVELKSGWISNDIDSETGLEKVHPVTLSYIRATRLMMLVTEYGFLDVFDFIPGHPEVNTYDLYASADVHQGRRFASLDWLRRMKMAAGRPKDQDDLQNLPEAEQ